MFSCMVLVFVVFVFVSVLGILFMFISSSLLAGRHAID